MTCLDAKTSPMFCLCGSTPNAMPTIMTLLVDSSLIASLTVRAEPPAPPLPIVGISTWATVSPLLTPRSR